MTPTEVQLALPKFAPGVIVKVRHHPSDFRIIQILLIHTRPLDKSKSRYNFEFVFNPEALDQSIFQTEINKEIMDRLGPYGFLDRV